LKPSMRTLESIHREIDELSERRVELWHELSEGHDAELQAEVRRLEERLEELWDEQRQLRAELRWGDRKRIIARARAEERLERHAA
jgi:ABC-type phosphate transport system auxiliary subunit